MSKVGYLVAWYGVVALASVALLVRTWRPRRQRGSRFRLAMTSADAISRLDHGLSSERGIRWSVSGNTISVMSYVVPAWAKLVALLLFPVGMVALLARSTARGAIELEDDGRLTTAVCVGNLPRKVVARVERLS